MNPPSQRRPLRTAPAATLLFAGGMLLALPGCGGDGSAGREPPAKVARAVAESDLNTITLSDEAADRLGIQVTAVEHRPVRRVRSLGGEVVVPFEREITVAAPVASTVLPPATGAIPLTGSYVRRGQPILRLLALLPESDLLRVGEQLAVAEAEYDAAKREKERADALVRDRVITASEHETAVLRFNAAEAALLAARARRNRVSGESAGTDANLAPITIDAPRDGVLWHVYVATTQTVAPSAPLFEVISIDPMWVRVPIYVGELGLVARDRPAVIHALGGGSAHAGRTGRPIAAPPSADPIASTADLYFEVANVDGQLRPGQRVGVTVQLAEEETGLVVPFASLLYDAGGGTWVYERRAENVFARRRVEVRYVTGEDAVLAQGPPAGTPVVHVGAAELFGTEFGTGK